MTIEDHLDRIDKHKGWTKQYPDVLVWEGEPIAREDAHCREYHLHDEIFVQLYFHDGKLQAAVTVTKHEDGSDEPRKVEADLEFDPNADAEAIIDELHSV